MEARWTIALLLRLGALLMLTTMTTIATCAPAHVRERSTAERARRPAHAERGALPRRAEPARPRPVGRSAWRATGI